MKDPLKPTQTELVARPHKSDMEVAYVVGKIFRSCIDWHYHKYIFNQSLTEKLTSNNRPIHEETDQDRSVKDPKRKNNSPDDAKAL